jgi:hypothetical protein
MNTSSSQLKKITHSTDLEDQEEEIDSLIERKLMQSKYIPLVRGK